MHQFLMPDIKSLEGLPVVEAEAQANGVRHYIKEKLLLYMGFPSILYLITLSFPNTWSQSNPFTVLPPDLEVLLAEVDHNLV